MVVLTDRGLVLRSVTLDYPLVSKAGRPPVTERDRVDRILHLANDIIGIIRTMRVLYVAIEGKGATFRGQAHVFQRGGLAYVVMTQLWLACHLFPEVVAASTARKVVLGYGHAKKPDVEAALKANRVELGSDHEADAYVVARWMYEQVKEENE